MHFDNYVQYNWFPFLFILFMYLNILLWAEVHGLFQTAKGVYVPLPKLKTYFFFGQKCSSVKN